MRKILDFIGKYHLDYVLAGVTTCGFLASLLISHSKTTRRELESRVVATANTSSYHPSYGNYNGKLEWEEVAGMARDLGLSPNLSHKFSDAELERYVEMYQSQVPRR